MISVGVVVVLGADSLGLWQLSFGRGGGARSGSHS